MRPSRQITPTGSDAHHQFVEVAAATFGLADAPISIDADGSAIHGIIFDHARLIGREAARVPAGGQSIGAPNVLGTMTTPRFVVVAYPVECPGREAIRAQTMAVTDANGQSPRSLREARGPDIGTLVAGFNVCLRTATPIIARPAARISRPTIANSHFAAPIGGFDERLDAGRRVAVVGVLHGDTDERASLQIDTILR